MRKWLKTRPNLAAFNESIATNQSFISQANNINNKSVSFSMISEHGYFDVVCQICAVCTTLKNTNYLVVWDGTKSM